jgi:hypothetical protein
MKRKYTRKKNKRRVVKKKSKKSGKYRLMARAATSEILTYSKCRLRGKSKVICRSEAVKASRSHRKKLYKQHKYRTSSHDRGY